MPFEPAFRLGPDSPDYPFALRRLGELEKPVLTSHAPLSFEGKRLAIVGSREPRPGVAEWVFDFAKRVAKRGVTIVSGGAIGVDRAAHEGALEAEGATWVVCTTGAARPHDPEENEDLYERILKDPKSRLVSPFADDVERTIETPRARNKTLVGLADVTLVVQAHLKSGSRNAITWARDLRCPLFIMVAPVWMAEFAGSNRSVMDGVGTPLLEEGQLLATLGLEPSRTSSAVKKSSRRKKRAQLALLDREENRIISSLSDAPQHVDWIASKTGLGIPPLLTALLTLSAKNVVVEGPDGFFRLEI